MQQLSPEQIADIAARVISEERMNFGKSSDSDGGRAQRNRDWARIAGIVHHGHPKYNPTPDPRWHIKDAGGGRPQSDDVLAFKDTRMIIDFIGGAGADGFTVRAGHWEGPIGPEQNIYAPPVPDGGGGVSVPVPPPPSDVWTAAHQDIWNRLTTKTPLVVAQQLAHSFPAESWGRKRAGAGRAISDNTIARLMPNGRLFGVKVQPMVVLWGELDAAQVFEGVSPVNHLGTSTPPVGPVDPTPPVPLPPSVPDSAILDALTDIHIAMGDIAKAADGAKAAADAAALAVETASKKKLRIKAKASFRGDITGTIEPE